MIQIHLLICLFLLNAAESSVRPIAPPSPFTTALLCSWAWSITMFENTLVDFRIVKLPGRDTNSEKHHEDSPTAQKDFWNKIQRLIQVFIDYENPFQEESTDIHKLDSKEVVKSEVGKIANLLETGSRQVAILNFKMASFE
jgi:hypothetical protein